MRVPRSLPFDFRKLDSIWSGSEEGWLWLVHNPMSPPFGKLQNSYGVCMKRRWESSRSVEFPEYLVSLDGHNVCVQRFDFTAPWS